MTVSGQAGKPTLELPIHRAGSFATLVLDAVCVAGFFLLQPLLTSGFQSKNVLWGWVVVIGYLSLCLCSWMLMRLQPPPQQPQSSEPSTSKEDKSSSTGCLAFLALCFGLMVVVMLIELTGALEEGGFLDRLSGNGFAESCMAFGVVLLPLVYLFIVVIKPKPVVLTGTTSHFIQRTVATVGINLMFIITLAYWDSSIANSEPMDLAIGGRILVFLLSYAVMLMFLAPPRLILNSIDGTKFGLTSFCFWLAVYTWKLTV